MAEHEATSSWKKRETRLLGNHKTGQPDFQVIKWEEGWEWAQKTAKIYSAPTMYQHNLCNILKALHQSCEMNGQLRLRW